VPRGEAESRTVSDGTGPPFLLDTHVWFWYLTGSERLAGSLRQAIDGAVDRLWLSPLSVWELGMLDARGRVRLSGGIGAWYEEARRVLPLQEAPLVAEVAVRSHSMHLGHRDPVDHLLAATALVFDLTLMTVDERLRSASGLRTRSA
jgi:PIN domain nuclease of toxin-antitoxin system